ncbi:MAG: LicD family protein [Eubacteriales bacterium]|nr:LicD family protein [Eubacteriales bacterium]
MVDLQIEIPEEFWEEEVRQGYTVTREAKRIWAVQLDLLHKLDTVCKKYGLRYFADSGTLLGAAREHGFIPWDDDIDIAMLRADYELLKKVADKEFQHPYFYQDMYRDEGLIRPHAQLRNSETTGYLPQEEDRPYNKGIFLDIFPLDVLPDEGPVFKLHIAKIKTLWRTIEYGGYTRDAEHKLKGRIFRVLTDGLYKVTDVKKLFARYEKLCAKYNGSDYHRMSYVCFSRGKEKNMFRKEWWDETVMLPFEFTEVPAPAGYHERLTQEFKDYMTPRNVAAGHPGAILSADLPYQEFIRRRKEERKKAPAKSGNTLKGESLQ